MECSPWPYYCEWFLPALHMRGTCLHTCKYGTRNHTYTYACTHIYIYTYVHMHTHTCTYTYTHTCDFQPKALARGLLHNTTLTKVTVWDSEEKHSIMAALVGLRREEGHTQHPDPEVARCGQVLRKGMFY